MPETRTPLSILSPNETIIQNVFTIREQVSRKVLATLTVVVINNRNAQGEYGNLFYFHTTTQSDGVEDEPVLESTTLTSGRRFVVSFRGQKSEPWNVYSLEIPFGDVGGEGG